MGGWEIGGRKPTADFHYPSPGHRQGGRNKSSLSSPSEITELELSVKDKGVKSELYGTDASLKNNCPSTNCPLRNRQKTSEGGYSVTVSTKNWRGHFGSFICSLSSSGTTIWDVQGLFVGLEEVFHLFCSLLVNFREEDCPFNEGMNGQWRYDTWCHELFHFWFVLCIYRQASLAHSCVLTTSVLHWYVKEDKAQELHNCNVFAFMICSSPLSAVPFAISSSQPSLSEDFLPLKGFFCMETVHRRTSTWIWHSSTF